MEDEKLVTTLFLDQDAFLTYIPSMETRTEVYFVQLVIKQFRLFFFDIFMYFDIW